jgi:iron(III) transport system substrate-binding protein
MRKIIMGLAGTVAALLANAPAGAQDLGGRLVVYYSNPRESAEPLFEAFTKKYGVQVRSLRQPTEELMTTLDLEMRAGQAKPDVVFATTAALKNLNARYGALRSSEPAGIEMFPEALRDPEKTVIPVVSLTYVITYNTKAVTKEEAPKSFADLLDPKWKGKIAMADPASSATVHGAIWLLTEHLKSKGAPYGWGYFERLALQEVFLTNSHGTVGDLVSNGERPIGLNTTGQAHRRAVAGEPIAWTWPAEGATIEALVLGLMKDSNNPKAADKFAEFALSSEGQSLVGGNTGMAPLRNDADFTFADGSKISTLTVPMVPVDTAFVAAESQMQTDKFKSIMGRK